MDAVFGLLHLLLPAALWAHESPTHFIGEETETRGEKAIHPNVPAQEAIQQGLKPRSI